MIDYVLLKNFLSHKETKVFFSDGLNSIVGLSDAGKTHIFRALDTLLFHKDLPEEMVSWWADSCLIEVGFRDGRRITRTRSKTGQTTSVVNLKGETKFFQGKDDAEEAVREVSEFRKIALDPVFGPENLNIIEVYDTIYILNLRGDVIRRRVSGILGINAIEGAMVSINKKFSTEKKALTATEKEDRELKKDIEKANSEIETVEGYANKAKRIEASVVVCSAQLSMIEALSVTLSQEAELKEKLMKTDRSLSKLTEAKTVIDKTIKARQKLDAVEFLSKSSEKLNKLYALLSTLALISKEGSILAEKIKTNCTKYKTTEDLKDTQATVEQLIKEAVVVEHSKVETEEQKAIALKESGECPTCGQTVG